ncbi:MAG: CvpA family protein [Chromatiaceae bacterium]|nr:MAG: CvpA family protein [Chromatiaceae bacterium]
MILIDYVILAIIAISALIGLARGLIREVISLGVWLLALLAAWLFYEPVAVQLAPLISTPSLRIGVAVLILVLGVLLAGAVVAFLLTLLVEKTGLTGTDRVLGLAFGAGRGALVVALLVFLASLTPLTQDPWWEESRLLAQFQGLAGWLLAQVPPELTERVQSL